MAFYIIEKEEQLKYLNISGDCFVDFILYNNNFHSKLNSISLIYIRPINDHKGYLLCLNHSESFSIELEYVINWIHTNTDRLFVIDKKKVMYFYPHYDNLYDINFIEEINLELIPENKCINWYYNKHYSLFNVNNIIPLSKHYENQQNTFNIVKPIIDKFNDNDIIYKFNNINTNNVFFKIEQNGIHIDKTHFTNHYGEVLKYPQYNIIKSKIYSNYNLYTTTGRPSNSFNNINFAALNKTNGERLCYKPSNDLFIEFDIQGYHPRIMGELTGFSFPKDTNVYEYIGQILGVTTDKAKELTFKQMYGGVWSEYIYKPFFKDVISFTDNIWDVFNYSKHYSTKNRIFKDKSLNQTKLLNYVIQSIETSNNVVILEKINDYLKTKTTKLVLYTYDAFLLDFSRSDGKQMLHDINDIIGYPTNIKSGKNYHDLKKI